MRARLRYYLSRARVSHDDVRRALRRDQRRFLVNGNELQDISERLERFSPDVVIVTATHNRYAHLERLFGVISKQRFSGKIGWIVVENGSTDRTVDVLARWETLYPGFAFLRYSRPFGYAAPARNRGLAFAQWVLRHRTRRNFIWVIDSDDTLFDEYVLHDLVSIARARSSALVHGFADCTYSGADGQLIVRNTIPRDTGSFFPSVPTLKDEFECGPQIISGVIDTELLPNFYYPDEFTMEDDTLSRRIMAWVAKERGDICAVNRATIRKSFHIASMSGINSRIGSVADVAQLGPIQVTGIRAQIVRGLIHARDYFTREGV